MTKSALVLFLILLTFGASASAQDTEGFRNPLNQFGGADPWLTYYDGYYYLAATTWSSELTMRRSERLAGLKTAEPVQIYREANPSRCCNMWAPEFFLLDGPNGPRWYFYYTAGITTGNYSAQHTHVLESEGTDPLGPYTYKGRLFDPSNDTWSIDGSVLQLNDSLYFLFSAFAGNLQSMFIAPMSDPWTISGSRVLLSQPELPWELVGGNVNEGPVALQHDDDTFIIYSASACWTADYKLGMLIYQGGDPLASDAWLKHPEPVFQRSDAAGVYGPAHNGFFLSPDGTENWIVYHANDSASDGCDGGRTTRAQPFTWNEDGTPNFGEPVSEATVVANPSGDSGVDPLPETDAYDIIHLGLAAHADAIVRHSGFRVRIDWSVNPPGDGEFVIVPGLADPEAVSIQSANFPGFYMRYRNEKIWIRPYDETPEFDAEATWIMQEGLTDAEGISFESFDQPGMFLMVKDTVINLMPVETDEDRENATFYIE